MNDVDGFLSSILVTLITLLPIVNPLSTAILVVFLLAGHFIMIFFGISIPGIRIAGGMVIGFLGFKMLFPVEAKITREEKQEAIKKSNISFSPLAMPSLAGPGAIATVITISSSIDGRHGYDKAFAFAGAILAIIITAIIAWLVLRSAGFVSRILGVNGVDSLSRIMGFLLICIGVQFVILGVQDLISDSGLWQKL